MDSAGLHGKLIVLHIILQLVLRSCQEPLESLTPLILKVHPDPLQQQRLVVEWDISNTVYPSSVNVIFHIQVARSQKKNIIHDEYYNTSFSGKAFSWSWDSELPLECDSHSVRIRTTLLQDSFPYEEHWSAWSQWKSHHGKNTETRKNIVIYPHEKILPEGSDVTFCCLTGPLQKVQQMTYDRVLYPSRSQQMNTESFVITVKNVSMTNSEGNNVICQVDSMGSRLLNGTVLIVSRPPNEPKNFSCETNDLQRLHCSWRPGPKYNFYGNLAENYTLQDRLSGISASCSRETCIWPIVRNQQIYHFTLNVKNKMGEKSIQAVVDPVKRVRPMAPTNLLPGPVNMTEVEFIWTFKADYTSLVLRCQMDLKEHTVNVTIKGKPSMEMYRVSVTQLQPSTKYDVRVRCMSESSLAGWSNWSDVLPIQTQEAAPSDPLDVWREIQHHENGQSVTLHWKHPSGFKANGKISHYNIQWWPLGGNILANKTRVSAQQHSYSMDLGGQVHVISITAQNGAGESPAAEMKVPASSRRGDKEVKTERTQGRDGEIDIRWSSVPGVHGYVVEWCNSPRSPHCDLQWKKYNFSTYGDVIHSASFQRGVRYDFQVYGSQEDGEHLLKRLTGYTKELASSKKPKVVTTRIDTNSLSVDWSPYPLDETQEGFVVGYAVYMKMSGKDCELKASNGHIILDGLDVCRFFIEDPKVMNATIHQLKANTEYQVAVVAVTGGGETAREFIKASTPSDAGAMIMPFLLPGIMVLVLAIALLITGYWKRVWLKETCYPNIPQPNKSKVISFNSPQKLANISVLPDVSSVPQKVERVYIVQKTDVGHNLNDNSDQQTDVMYYNIQRPPNSANKESTFDMYFANGSENECPHNQPAEELLYTSQSPTYLEFFNENYTVNSDDSYDESLGYRPQMGSSQLQSSEDSSGNHSRGSWITSLFSTENEPLSPTSVNSTSFMLKD